MFKLKDFLTLIPASGCSEIRDVPVVQPKVSLNRLILTAQHPRVLLKELLIRALVLAAGVQKSAKLLIAVRHQLHQRFWLIATLRT